ncbi:MAG: CHASE2 domain-containing protein, partial [Planctomycetota bacterium]
VIASIIILLINFYSPQYIKSFMRSVDAQLQDLMFRVRGTITEKDRGKEFASVVVDVDEKSLDKLGQWPWPRFILADLMKKIDACGPKAIGLDIVFAEPDKTSLKVYLKRLKEVFGSDVELPEDIEFMEAAEVKAALSKILKTELKLPDEDFEKLDNDAMFAEVIENTPSIVLGYTFSYHDDGLREEDLVPYGAGNYIAVRDDKSMKESIFKASGNLIPYRPIINTPIIDDAAEDRSGCFSTSFDEAGKVRVVPLLWEYENNLYGSLALQMLRVGMGEPNGKVHYGPYGITHIEFRNLMIPTDSVASLYANFRGPGKTFTYVSAADVVSGNFDPKVFKDKYVLLGTSAGGLLDLRVNPFDDAYPGVEVHATIIDNILHGDLISTPTLEALILEQRLILIFGIILSAVLSYLKPLTGTLFSIGLFVLIFYVAYYMMFTHNEILNISYLSVTLTFVFMTVTMFNYFSEGKQKRFIAGAFGTYLSHELVEQLVENPDKLSLKGEEKDLTVLFSDIRSFTSISEKLTAEELSQLLNEYLTPMSDIVMESKGYVDKYIGDAVMAFWGAPVEDDAHAANASRASLKMMEVLGDLQKGWDERGMPTIEIGIGLNSGVMSVGNMGSQNRFNYTVMGDNVNLGSRLEGLNKPYGTNIIISESTRDEIGSDFCARMIDMVRVKGKLEPV